MGFEFDVMKVVDTAVSVGVIANEVDAIRLTKFVLLLQGVRQSALEEAMEICRVVADRAHLSMWEYRGHNLESCAELEKARVDTAELIQRALHGKVQNENRTSKEDEGRQGNPSQAGSASSAEARAVGAVRPEAAATSPAAQAGSTITGGENG